ncbi:hypothetical protein GCM10009839_16150 [Catenulispora yoronensis]|uniref:Uncharacterized protein n=1 Tax=Catenulispora yoronensis TaxID=450799 RepID=A0ABN2TU78_9ACTN
MAASAILATSVASAAGLVQSANATPAGAANSPLTITNGTQSVQENGHVVQYGGKIDQGSWAPDGSRIAYVRADGAVVTEHAGGGNIAVVAPAKAGVTRSHPTWVAGGTGIVFAETGPSGTTLNSVPAYTDPHDAVDQHDPLSFLAGQPFTEGSEKSPEANKGSLTFVHGTSVYIQDGFGRGSDGPHLVAANGAEPTLSPDGKTVVFVRADAGGNQQLWAAAWDSANPDHPGAPVQLTTDAHDHTNPAFSPDGSRIAFENGPHGGAATDVQSIAKDGSGQRQESAQPGVPAYQPQNQDTVTRLSGADRVTTAIAASQAQWKNSSTTNTASAVVLSRSDEFADALGGSTLAVRAEGPLLLTPTDHLDAGVKAEISRVLGAASLSKTVYVLGGEKALSPAVFNAVHAMGYTVKRISGNDRYETSVAIAKEVTGLFGGPGTGWVQPDRVLVATGNNAPDALSAGAAAESGNGGGPVVGVVVLTNDKTMPASTGAYLAQVKAHNNPQGAIPVYGVGGQADTALKSIGFQHTPLAGADRFQTSYLVAKTFFGDWDYGSTSPRTVGFATGLTWPDALSGGAFMGQHDGPLLLVDGSGQPSKDAQNWLLGWAPSINSGYIFGGLKAVPASASVGLPGLYAGPAGAVSLSNTKA